jgi:hypothetical protein
MTNILTAARLREVLNYCPETGVWTWVKSNSNRAKVGAIAGCIDGDGYRRISIDGRLYASSRLAFLYLEGEWPPHFVDHIDRCRNNDRWSNLRHATRLQNNVNRPSRNKSGFKGVSWDGGRGKWQALIMLNGKTKYLGAFNDPTIAAAAYAVAARELFGEYSFSGTKIQAAA